LWPPRSLSQKLTVQSGGRRAVQAGGPQASAQGLLLQLAGELLYGLYHLLGAFLNFHNDRARLVGQV